MRKCFVAMAVIAVTGALAIATFAFARAGAREGAPERVRKMNCEHAAVQAQKGAEEGAGLRERIREKSCSGECEANCEQKGGLTDEQRAAIRTKKQELIQAGATNEEVVAAIKAMLDEYGVEPPKGAVQNMRMGHGRRLNACKEGGEGLMAGEGRRGKGMMMGAAGEDGQRNCEMNHQRAGECRHQQAPDGEE